MILKTTDFQNVCKSIVLAVDSSFAANLELVTKDSTLYLNLTNSEYYASVKFPIESTEEFRAVVDASLFLNLISGITTEDFELDKKDNSVAVKAGKSNYKLAMIYKNNELMTLPVISIENKTVTMPVSLDILRSVLNVNSKELTKIKNSKNVDIAEIQKLYYFTNEGCFTFTTGATLNRFKLDSPIKVLLNDRIVKLFKLFREDVTFSLGHDALPNGVVQTKICFETDNTYLAAIVTNDEVLLNQIQGPCTATKRFIEEKYDNSVVLSTKALSAALSRLMLFTKNSVDSANMRMILANVEITNNDFTITDKLGNSETIAVENGSYVDADYSMPLNIADLKLVLDSCEEDHITLNCGNMRSIVISRGNISNLIPEGKRD